MSNIAMIPADSNGNKLFLKNVRIDEKGRLFVKYKSTFNDMPFFEVELFSVDSGKNFAICGDDGTVLYRFSVLWIQKINRLK